MTPEQFDAFLTVAKKHGVAIVRIGEMVLAQAQAAPAELPRVPFVPGAPPDPPSLPAKGDGDPVKRWDAVDAAMWPEGLPT